MINGFSIGDKILITDNPAKVLSWDSGCRVYAGKYATITGFDGEGEFRHDGVYIDLDGSRYVWHYDEFEMAHTTWRDRYRK